MSVRRVVSKTIGAAQAAIGMLTIVFAYALFHNFFDIQSILNVSTKNIALYMLLLSIFGLSSIVSGLFLVREG